jgi:hypothetical protein
MPSNIVHTPPGEVMPMGLMILFESQAERRALTDTGYALGESTRQALTLTSRKRFRVSRRLTLSEAQNLRAFYIRYRHGAPFWFYDLRETEPPGSWDPAGANPIGRYAVVFEGPLMQSAGPSRGNSEYLLREVVEG